MSIIFMQVRKPAIKAVKERGGNIADETEVLSEMFSSLGPFVAKHSAECLKMPWAILHGSLTACKRSLSL